MSAASAPGDERGTGFRPDIEGLRAVAVVLILLFHAGVPAVAGGFVGVDVFFVISGFLITGLLVRELDGTGRLDLLEFYARRARRILPAALVVLAATAVGTFIFLSPIALWRAAPDIAASAAYVPNFLFAFQQSDYFHPAQVSPVVHYWSLGVEEQFYVLWPAILWLLHRSAGGRTRLTWLVAGLVAVSLALSIVGTVVAPSAAFYLLPTRAWELGAGALVALAGQRVRLSPAGSTFVAVLGLGLVAASGVLFTSATPFPGFAAVVPVLGTVMVIVAGASTRLPGSLLAWAPTRYVGRISYSLYLWHWPVLLFAAAALGGLPEPARAAMAVAVSFVLAAITYRLVEDPLRHGRLIGRRPTRNLVTALAGSAAIVALALGGGWLGTERFRQADGEITAPVVGDPFVGVLPTAAPSGAPTAPPTFPPTLDGPLPADLIPPLLNLHRGVVKNNPGADGCSLQTGETVNGACTYGDPTAPTTVALLGDSHIAQWWPALERIMEARDWKVVFLIKTSCNYADVTTMSDSGPRVECDTWREGAFERLARERPDLVIVASNHWHQPNVDGVVLDGPEATAAMQAGVVRTIERLQALGARVALISDTPRIPFDPAECLSANSEHTIRCAIPRDEALDPAWLVAERAAAASSGATYVDVNAWICPTDPCPMVLGRYAVFADTNHVTRPFVQALTKRLQAALQLP